MTGKDVLQFALVWLFGWSICVILLVGAISHLRGDKAQKLKVELAERFFARIAFTLLWQWPFVVLSTIAHVIEDLAGGADDQ